MRRLSNELVLVEDEATPAAVPLDDSSARITLRLPEAPHNLAWGDDDGRTLYVTALTSVYRLRLAVPGIRPQ